jgi:hypothetical protein
MIVACSWVMFVGVNLSQAKEWHGIVPLRSTREDVARQLGTPTRIASDAAYYYNFGSEVAVIWFQSSPCDSESGLGQFGFGWKVPIGTVTSIGIVPNNSLSASRFVDDQRFRVEGGGAGYIYHIDSSEGLIVEAHNGRVISFTYMPTEAENNLRCPRIQECCVDFFPMDEYGNIPYEDEKARLDNLAIELRNAPQLRGVITVYGGRRGRAGEARLRAERARNYLVRVRGIEAGRIVAVDGGHREDLTVVLNLQPIGHETLNRISAYPTVAPEEVQIIENNRRNRRRRRARP